MKINSEQEFWESLRTAERLLAALVSYQNNVSNRFGDDPNGYCIACSREKQKQIWLDSESEFKPKEVSIVETNKWGAR